MHAHKFGCKLPHWWIENRLAWIDWNRHFHHYTGCSAGNVIGWTGIIRGVRDSDHSWCKRKHITKLCLSKGRVSYDYCWFVYLLEVSPQSGWMTHLCHTVRTILDTVTGWLLSLAGRVTVYNLSSVANTSA